MPFSRRSLITTRLASYSLTANWKKPGPSFQPCNPDKTLPLSDGQGRPCPSPRMPLAPSAHQPQHLPWLCPNIIPFESDTPEVYTQDASVSAVKRHGRRSEGI